MRKASRLHVAVAVIENSKGEVLVAKRPPGVHQGGLWEFPGGKVAPGEAVRAALDREIEEELGLTVLDAVPWMRIPYDYPERSVLLDVWRVTAHRGRAEGREGQEIAWVPGPRLTDLAFPTANHPILRALTLPRWYGITPEIGDDRDTWMRRLWACLAAGMPMLQLRLKALPAGDYRSLVEAVLRHPRPAGTRILLNQSPEMVLATGADGVHLDSRRLMACTRRPLSGDLLVGASCHNRAELDHAAAIGVDFVVLSPVRQTISHPGAVPLGWRGFSELAGQTGPPVYALGGVGPGDMTAARAARAQGIAAMRAFWDAEDLDAILRTNAV